MNNHEFEAFHYKDARPGGIVMHTHDFYEVYLFLGGEVQFQIENAIYALSRGDLLLVSPLELHRPIVRSGDSVYERIVLWIDRLHLRLLKQDFGLDFERCFDPNQPQHANLFRLNDEELQVFMTLFDLILREQQARQYGVEVMRTSLLVQILTLLNRLAQPHAAVSGMPASDQLVDQVFHYIHHNLAGDLSLRALSKHFYADPVTLSRRFKRQLGSTIPAYVRQKRLTMARNMLMEGEKAAAAALRCGYADYSSFFRAFRAHYGTSPKAFVETLRSRER